jgi:nicotinamide mononucleotide (NMN) deamidase PncC
VELIEQNNAVTREVAVAMAEGALEHSRANVALAITGFATREWSPASSTSPAPAPDV